MISNSVRSDSELPLCFVDSMYLLKFTSFSKSRLPKMTLIFKMQTVTIPKNYIWYLPHLESVDTFKIKPWLTVANGLPPSKTTLHMIWVPELCNVWVSSNVCAMYLICFISVFPVLVGWAQNDRFCPFLPFGDSSTELHIFHCLACSRFNKPF